MHKSQSLSNLIIALHVSGVTITHLQEHKTTASTASGKRYTVIDRVKFTDKEYQQTRLKFQLLNNVYVTMCFGPVPSYVKCCFIYNLH